MADWMSDKHTCVLPLSALLPKQGAAVVIKWLFTYLNFNIYVDQKQEYSAHLLELIDFDKVYLFMHTKSACTHNLVVKASQVHKLGNISIGQTVVVFDHVLIVSLSRYRSHAVRCCLGHCHRRLCRILGSVRQLWYCGGITEISRQQHTWVCYQCFQKNCSISSNKDETRITT